jgi:hypothetical protein
LIGGVTLVRRLMSNRKTDVFIASLPDNNNYYRFDDRVVWFDDVTKPKVACWQ